MKKKTMAVLLVVCGAAAAGLWYGARFIKSATKKAIQVESVAMLNEAENYAGWYSTDTLTGTVVSADEQSVDLDTSMDLKEVFVQEGDEVKVGDKLLEYDSTLLELQEEAKELTLMGLELKKQTQEAMLAQLQAGVMPESYISGSYSYEDLAMLDLDSDDDTGSSDEEVLADDSGDADLVSAAGSGDADLVSAADSGNADLVSAGAEDDADIVAGAEEVFTDTDDIDYNGSSVISESSEEPDQETLLTVNDFLNQVNEITETANSGWEFLDESELTEAMNLYRTALATVKSEEITDLLGDTRTRSVYSLNETVATQVGEATAEVLQTAYDRLCVYQYIYAMQQLNPEGHTSYKDFSDEELKARGEQLDAALDAFYALQSTAYRKGKFTADYNALNADPDHPEQQTMVKILRGIVKRLANMAEIETEEPDVEPETDDNWDDGWDDWGGSGSDYTAEDIATALEEVQLAIKQNDLDIRKTELEIRQMKRQLEAVVVKATIDGVVETAGTVDGDYGSSGFIVIKGAQGFYISGRISELKLDSIKVGDVLSGTSWWGSTQDFEATVAEIAVYPSTSTGYYYYNSGNTNVSYYDFKAYVADSDSLSEGDEVELTIQAEEEELDIMIPNYFVRTDMTGQKYVYIADENGLLKKQNVTATENSWFEMMTIREGLTEDDLIAFPYPDSSMVIGSPTVEVDELDAVAEAYAY